MTVKELFQSLSFDEIAETLRTTHAKEKSTETMVGYKEAFDIIRHTEFEGEGGEVTFDIEDKEDNDMPILARNVEGDYWKNTVGKQVVIPPVSVYPMAYYAAAILWGMTFYGFTPRDRRRSFDDEPYCKWGEMAERLNDRKNIPYIRDKAYRKKCKCGKADYVPVQIILDIFKRKEHQNGPKRKRNYRIKKRIAYLENLDKRQWLIDSLRRALIPLSDTMADRIFNAGMVHETWMDSFTYGECSRVPYISECVEKYFSSKLKKESWDIVLTVAYTSPEHPITSEEKIHPKTMLTSFHAKKTEFFESIENDLGKELALQLILIK